MKFGSSDMCTSCLRFYFLKDGAKSLKRYSDVPRALEHCRRKLCAVIGVTSTERKEGNNCDTSSLEQSDAAFKFA